MEQNKGKIEGLFSIIEARLGASSRLPVGARQTELEQIGGLFRDLERLLTHFEMVGFAKYADDIERFENKMEQLQKRYRKMRDKQLTYSQVPQDASTIQPEPVDQDVVNMMVARTNQNLAEGKARAENMLKLANNMKDELEQLDDEVALQKEKLLAINSHLKNTQSLVNNTKKLVTFFARTVNDDKYIKYMIGAVLVMLVCVIAASVAVRYKKKERLEKVAEKMEVQMKQADYSRIDEVWFHNKKKEVYRPPSYARTEYSEVKEEAGETVVVPTPPGPAEEPEKELPPEKPEVAKEGEETDKDKETDGMPPLRSLRMHPPATAVPSKYVSVRNNI